ncbi:uncharacterized protein BO72DRAFT_122388 [Aspergillus fijiensis CBS 313.89]|uniref:Cytochrome P450 n=1 Tax=Aspergillus fijiensis CBS 313.89 TaxID=1448319 RepID=A0A8G1RU92_9EURO|nr:uncharacterized protein BO72DRAFT_122388 [Aspergillus fijiensis CBS 313.89]RAK76866.1 hypothetical protein BO72DRAFT_122388 [Aspergillus fijiensis CBS 313.89]
MLALLFFAAARFCSVSYLFILPIVRYFHEPKGLRKHPGFSPLSGFTDLRHIYLSACGYRSKDLYEAHRRAPILRTGPNSLSFGDTHAIKDIYGHSTPCLKDLNYVVLGESHAHIFDVVDTSDHARQHKTLFAAFALENLERGESKVARRRPGSSRPSMPIARRPYHLQTAQSRR